MHYVIEKNPGPTYVAKGCVLQRPLRIATANTRSINPTKRDACENFFAQFQVDILIITEAKHWDPSWNTYLLSHGIMVL